MPDPPPGGGESSSAQRKILRGNTPTATMNKTQLAQTGISSITNAETARSLLEKWGYATPQQFFTHTSLAQILFALSQEKALKTLQEGVRAIAWILEDGEREDTAKKVTEQVMERLRPMAEQIENDMANLGIIVEDVRNAATALTMVGDTVKGQMEEGMTELNEVVSEIGTATHSTTHTTTNRENSIPSQQTMADIVRQHLPLHQQITLARNQSRTKQVLIDIDKSQSGENSLSNLDEATLVAKANAALTLMERAEEVEQGEERDEAEKRPEGTKFVTATKQREGGILFEMNSAAAATWIRQARIKTAFAANFGTAIIVRDRTFNLIMEFVPISLNLEGLAEKEHIERDNGWKQGAIERISWLKPVDRRKEGQRTAHLLLKIKDEDTANKALREGMVLAGKRVWGRRTLPEPKRCMKCQALDGHYAAKCPSEKDICGTCGEDHKTSTCENHGNADKLYCKNCETAGHAAWDRSCPVYAAKADALRRRYQEDEGRYFTTEDPTTWEIRGSQGRRPWEEEEDDERRSEDEVEDQVRRRVRFAPGTRFTPGTRGRMMGMRGRGGMRSTGYGGRGGHEAQTTNGNPPIGSRDNGYARGGAPGTIDAYFGRRPTPTNPNPTQS